MRVDSAAALRGGAAAHDCVVARAFRSGTPVVDADPPATLVGAESRVSRRLNGPDAAYRSFLTAIRHVTKSGEVWCEGARVFLDPSSGHFSPRNAALCLNYAVFFTPQYGDSYIEVSVRRCVSRRDCDSCW